MITNHAPDRVRRALAPDMAVLYHPTERDWSYSHHASIAKYRGRFYAMWSSGRVNEDDLGQRVLYTASEDGLSWAEPRVLFDSMGEGVLTASGFWNCGDALAAYAGYYAYRPENIRDGHAVELSAGHAGTTLWRMESADGDVWSAPEDMRVPIVPNHGPQRIAGGRLVISGNIMFPYTDDPRGRAGWKCAATPPFPWEPLYDDSEGFELRSRQAGTPWTCEGSFFQTDDGVLHMLQRSRERVLYITESADDGETWSPSRPTEFTDCGSKFHCGRLPDGRFYVVSGPDAASPRCPLVLSVSRDGENFDREFVIDDRYVARRIEGRAKGGIYGYPHSLIDGEWMYVICSVNKEDVRAYRFALADLKEE